MGTHCEDRILCVEETKMWRYEGMNYLKAVWAFCLYLLWPQWGSKRCYMEEGRGMKENMKSEV